MPSLSAISNSIQFDKTMDNRITLADSLQPNKGNLCIFLKAVSRPFGFQSKNRSKGRDFLHGAFGDACFTCFRQCAPKKNPKVEAHASCMALPFKQLE